jgi:hypothetical protein
MEPYLPYYEPDEVAGATDAADPAVVHDNYRPSVFDARRPSFMLLDSPTTFGPR